jgi:hypothetical protein
MLPIRSYLLTQRNLAGSVEKGLAELVAIIWKIVSDCLGKVRRVDGYLDEDVQGLYGRLVVWY